MTTKPFSSPFLAQFTYNQQQAPFTNQALENLDKELNEYDQIFLDPALEKNLISKNEFLSSFAISKAENSTLTLQEAQDVYTLVLEHSDYLFLKKKIVSATTLKQKDYEKLEFLNIVKTVRAYNQRVLSLADITPAFIQSLHTQLTQGLDIFQQYIPGFTVYKAGQWRDNNQIRVGDYVPAPYDEIVLSINELISWFEHNQAVTAVGIFHTTLYAIHPFNNGNKRVARVLEHILLRIVGLNSKNFYSTSYYYHQEKDRYYKYLLYSLEKKNLTFFVSFFQEAVALSMLTVIQSSIEVQRAQFIKQKITNDYIKTIAQHLIKRRELQFKTLATLTSKKMARQTLVGYLQKGVEEGILTRRELGRAVYYRINTSPQQELFFDKLLAQVKPHLTYVPDTITLS